MRGQIEMWSIVRAHFRGSEHVCAWREMFVKAFWKAMCNVTEENQNLQAVLLRMNPRPQSGDYEFLHWEKLSKQYDAYIYSAEQTYHVEKGVMFGNVQIWTADWETFKLFREYKGRK